MKKINFYITLLLLSFFFSSSTIAQKNFIFGLSHQIEYSYKNVHPQKTAFSPGMFFQIPISRKISTISSASYARRYHLPNTNYIYAVCGLGIPQNEMWGANEEIRIDALTLEQFLKLQIFRSSKLSGYAGAGAIYRLPAKIERKAYFDEFTGRSYKSYTEVSNLEKNWGYELALGFDYSFSSNVQLTSQLGWNNLMNDSLIGDEHSHVYSSGNNVDNISLKLSLGYIF